MVTTTRPRLREDAKEHYRVTVGRKNIWAMQENTLNSHFIPLQAG